MPAEPAWPSGRRSLLDRLDGPWRATLVLALAYLALCVAGALRTGVSWDESEHRRYGELALDFYSSLGQERGAVSDRMSYYGALHVLVGAAAERLFPGLPWPSARHLGAVAFGLLAFVYCVRLARLLGGPWAGFVAGLLLATTPRWTGDAMYNPIDVPTAAVFLAALFHLVRLAQAPAGRAARRDWILFGVASGLTLAIRTVGLLLFLDAAFVLALWAFFGARPRGEVLRRDGPRALAHVVLASGIALAVAAACWPRLLIEPLSALTDSLTMTKSFPWAGAVMFQGKNISALHLPRSYLPVWLAITTPIAVLLGLALALGSVVRWQRSAPEARGRVALVVFALLFPLTYAAATHATLYDGIRHVLFVVPPLCALAAVAWVRALRALRERAPALRLAGVLVLGGAAVEPIVWYARSFPCSYVYFNPLVGGLAKASHDYETDYWGLSMRSAAEWLSDLRVRTVGAERPLVVASNAPWQLLSPWLDDPMQYRYVETLLASDVTGNSFDVLLLNYRFQNFRIKTLEPLATKTLVEGQAPFWLIYARPEFARWLPAGPPAPPR